jgi:hypothetical protein
VKRTRGDVRVVRQRTPKEEANRSASGRCHIPPPPLRRPLLNERGCSPRQRGGRGHGQIGGTARTPGPAELQVLEGSYTRAAMPPEASPAGPPEAYIFWGGAGIRRSRLWAVTGTGGAGCTSGACSPVQNTAFPGRARSRKGGSGGCPGRQPAPGELQGPRTGTAAKPISETAGPGGGGAKCTNCATNCPAGM